MSDSPLLVKAEPASVEGTRRLLRLAGMSYGVVFGLLYALVVWGYDGRLLAESHAYLAWAKLFMGLPVALLLGFLMGWIGAHFGSTLISALAGALTAGVLGWLTCRIPFDGASLVAGLGDRRFLGLEIYPYGVSAAIRARIVIFVLVVIGALVGLLQQFASDWAWNRATSKGRMSVLSWLGLLVSLPLVVAMAAVVDEMINEPVRTPQQMTGELINLTLAGDLEGIDARGLDYDSVRPFHSSLTPNYTVYLSQYDVNALYSGYVRANFDNGFTMRCFVIIGQVISCEDFGQKLTGWMDQIVHAGLTGERQWEEPRYPNLVVDGSVMAWLSSQGERLSESYEVTTVGQQGGWLLVAARFDHGFEMTCRFHDASPFRVDQCTESVSGGN